ncbi:MAG: metal ABC transporter substrate-binding protein [Gemmatimonadetes bacterium]|nr:metal ABC transporter substrate-binding protein [Gemmatimonadota bacterium]
MTFRAPAVLLAAVALLSAATAPPRTLNVVATTPDLAVIAKAIGGDAVDVKALAKPTEDPHFVDAKPSHILTLNRADVLIDGGAELELGWLPALLESARNAKIAAGAPGRVSAAQGVKLLEVPTSFDRSRGDVHALGNPHYLLDPVNARLIATNIAQHLGGVDPDRSAAYQANLKAFLTALDAKQAEWQAALAPYANARIVTYHKDFIYLAERFKLDVIATLEPKPGIAPSPAHLAEVISAMKAQRARVILVQTFQNRRTAETVARQTNGIVLDVSQQPGALPGTDTYFTMMDSIVRTLVKALAETK